MREKVMKLVVTFNSTSQAMAMESACKAKSVPGRIVPVPRSISASCGLSWIVEIEKADEVKSFIKNENLAIGDYHEMMLY